MPTTAERVAAAPAATEAASAGDAVFTKTAAADSRVEEVSAPEPEPEPEEPQLPPLTPAEFRVYNHVAEGMDVYHNHFRTIWNLLWNASVAGRRPSGMSLRAFVGEGIQFVRVLTLHHDIEEQHFFPHLARKMPEFKAGKGNGAAELLRQHREIHKGLGVLDAYLKDVRDGREELDLAVLKGKMEGWGGVLWTHLDQEVKTLGAENMRRYWTLEEMKAMPM